MSEELRVFLTGPDTKVRLCASDYPFLRASRHGIKWWTIPHWTAAGWDGVRHEVRREDPHIRLWVPADANVEARWREVDVLLAQEEERKQKIYKALQAPACLISDQELKERISIPAIPAPKMVEHTGPHGQRVKLPTYAPGASVATWAEVSEIWSPQESGRVAKSMAGDGILHVVGRQTYDEIIRQISERRERTTREVQRKLREFPRCCGEPCKLDFAGNLVRWACTTEVK